MGTEHFRAWVVTSGFDGMSMLAFSWSGTLSWAACWLLDVDTVSVLKVSLIPLWRILANMAILLISIRYNPFDVNFNGTADFNSGLRTSWRSESIVHGSANWTREMVWHLGQWQSVAAGFVKEQRELAWHLGAPGFKPESDPTLGSLQLLLDGGFEACYQLSTETPKVPCKQAVAVNASDTSGCVVPCRCSITLALHLTPECRVGLTHAGPLMAWTKISPSIIIDTPLIILIVVDKYYKTAL